MTSTSSEQATQVDTEHRHNTTWRTARDQAQRDQHRRAPRNTAHRADGELPGQLDLFGGEQ